MRRPIAIEAGKRDTAIACGLRYKLCAVSFVRRLSLFIDSKLAHCQEAERTIYYSDNKIYYICFVLVIKKDAAQSDRQQSRDTVSRKLREKAN